MPLDQVLLFLKAVLSTLLPSLPLAALVDFASEVAKLVESKTEAEQLKEAAAASDTSLDEAEKLATGG
jgi:hypothetical protein